MYLREHTPHSNNNNWREKRINQEFSVTYNYISPLDIQNNTNLPAIQVSFFPNFSDFSIIFRFFFSIYFIVSR